MDLSLTPTLIGVGVSLLGIAVVQLNRIGNTQSKQGELLAVLRTILTGEKGDNGINGEVKALRSRSHHYGDEIHVLHGKVDLHEMRLDNIERRTGPSDRRVD